ncbi:MAG: hypothetical protein NC393_02615 [Clostridium sp.]|nr:hypothetical protein [Clostridium sp.]MCM1170998.1 hypothetical protein [Clostridium sp.]MCM1208024.1 hypothetical protein [Ruminococcus sp.]
MTKAGRFFEEEKEQAVKETVKTFVINPLNDGMEKEKIIQMIPQMSLNDVIEIEKIFRRSRERKKERSHGKS